MVSQEIIYQHLHRKEYDHIISILHEHRKSLHEDPSMAYAINIFLHEYFNWIQTTPLNDTIRYSLWKLFTIHTQGYYELPSTYAVQLIAINWDKSIDETWYKASLPYPDDILCARIIREYEAQYHRKVAQAEMVTDPHISAVSGPTHVDFETKVVRTSSFQPYVKAYVRELEDLQPLADLLNQLPSVRKANVSPQRNNKFDLTIYPQLPYRVEETSEQVASAMEAYFNRRPFDPVFKDEIISSISEIAYFQVLDYIIAAGLNLEKTSRATAQWAEPVFRDFFVAHLNALSKKHFVTGEAFNHGGKTDILMQNDEKVNVLVTECKKWTGPEGLLQAIDQLIERYVCWRDEKTALLMFNTKIANFTQLIETALATVQTHRLFYRFTGKRKETSYSFWFRNADDPNKLIQLELILFNFYAR